MGNFPLGLGVKIEQDDQHAIRRHGGGEMLHMLGTRVKLRYAMPLAQMGLAAVLAWCHHLWQMAVVSSDSPGPSPAGRLLHSIDWPVLFVPYYGVMRFPWDSVTAVAVAGLLWYWVALNPGEFRQHKRILMFKWAPLRIAGDLLLIAVGAFFGLFCAATIDQGPLFDYPHLGSKWLWFLPTVVVQFIWSIALISFFGRDVLKLSSFRDFISNK